MIIEALYSRLKAYADLTAITTGIFPQFIPEGEDAPAVVYALARDEPAPMLDGPSDDRTALFNIDCYSLQYAQAHTMADAVEAALAGFRGTLGTSTPAISADNIRLERKLDLFETATKLNRVSMQFSIFYQ